MIPQIIHYVWVGPKPIPEQEQENIAQWRVLHPDWEFKFWNATTIDFSPRYLQGAIATKAWHRVSDYQRVRVLAEYGGKNLDTDIELRRPLDTLLQLESFVGVENLSRPDYAVNGAVMGAVKGHSLPSDMIKYFDKKLDGSKETHSFTSPGLVTLMLKARGFDLDNPRIQRVGGVTVFPPEYFYPYKYTEQFSEDCVTANTFAVHHWAKSWGDKPIPRTIRERAERKLRQWVPALFVPTDLRKLRQLESDRVAWARRAQAATPGASADLTSAG
ncbi:MAG: hypothetical protein K2X62_04160 [Beijerinckiaceae bacterium]|jgi:mannosyltransferase OCH1-like enzyme|nr:hypothetical protein [Beijerinckiaceae bacterium]